MYTQNQDIKLLPPDVAETQAHNKLLADLHNFVTVGVLHSAGPLQLNAAQYQQRTVLALPHETVAGGGLYSLQHRCAVGPWLPLFLGTFHNGPTSPP